MPSDGDFCANRDGWVAAGSVDTILTKVRRRPHQAHRQSQVTRTSEDRDRDVLASPWKPIPPKGSIAPRRTVSEFDLNVDGD
jgi:hypothetical protein